MKKIKKISQKNKRSKKLLLFSFLGISVSIVTLFILSTSYIHNQIHNTIYLENLQKGTVQWESPALTKSKGNQIQNVDALDDKHNGNNGAAASSTWTDTAIRGYANLTSINHGAAINFYVGTTLSNYNIEIYRMGWYGGTGAHLMQTITNLPGQNQPIPAPDPTTQLLQLNWNVSYTLQTDTTWVTGAYLAKLIGSDGTVSYIPFVVRDDSSTADILYQVPVNTWQAYNAWGGSSLYTTPASVSAGRAYKVSFDRPYAQWSGAGGFFDGDYNMIRFLESQGYNISYATSNDTQTNLALLNNHKVFLSNYHDEYWDKAMRDNLTNSLHSGKNLAFFDANNIYWQIRFEPSATGISNRVITCYKDATLDPYNQVGNPNYNPSLTTVKWRANPLNQPENALLGVMYASMENYPNSVPWVVSNSNSWVYNGTGLNNGDSIPGIVGYEFDAVTNNGQTPNSLITLSNSPVTDAYGVNLISNGSIYTYTQSNALVFTAGTIEWPWKVDDNTYQSHGADSRVQQITKNVLNAMINGIPTLTPTPTTIPTATPTLAPSATPTPTSIPVLPYTMYDESLINGWSNWSSATNNTLNFADTTHPYTGTHDTSWIANVAGAYINLHNNTAVTTTGYTYLTLALQASQTGQKVAVRMIDSAGNTLTAFIPLSNYGGDPVPGSYTVYKVPLTDLNAANKTITGVHIKNNTSTSQPLMYLDRVGFSN